MAYGDLTSDQLDSITKRLFAPPPETFAAPSGVPMGGLLGSSKNYFSQFARMQASREKAQEEQLLDQSFKFLQRADENEMGEFVDQYPNMARQLSPALARRAADLEESRALLPLLPLHMQNKVLDARGVPELGRVKAGVAEFNDSFTGPLGKVKSLSAKREIAGIANQWAALPADKTQDAARDALLEELTVALGEKELITEATAKSIAREAKKLQEPEPPPVPLTPAEMQAAATKQAYFNKQQQKHAPNWKPAAP